MRPSALILHLTKIFLSPLPKNKGSTHNTKKSWTWYLNGAQFVPNWITLIQKKILKSSLLKIKKLPYISIVDFIIEKQLLLQINKYTNISHTSLPFLKTQIINPFHNSGISPNLKWTGFQPKWWLFLYCHNSFGSSNLTNNEFPELFYHIWYSFELPKYVTDNKQLLPFIFILLYKLMLYLLMLKAHNLEFLKNQY